MSKPSHFHGKSALEHLKEARLLGAKASQEPHGIEIGGSINAFGDVTKDISLVLGALLLLNPLIPISFQGLICLSSALILWKSVRSAILGYSRLYRLHNLLEQEKWEITHNRQEEKQELLEIYQAKGLSGKLLQDVVDVLSADDNRLLEVMLQEEMGLRLEYLEHPLKQALGAFLGGVTASLILIPSIMFLNQILALAVIFLLIAFASVFASSGEKDQIYRSTIWTLATFALIFTITFLLTSHQA